MPWCQRNGNIINIVMDSLYHLRGKITMGNDLVALQVMEKECNGNDDDVENGLGHERKRERFGLRRVVRPRELVTAGVEQWRA